MVTNPSILAEIPKTEEPEGLQTMGLQRVGQNLVLNNSVFICKMEVKMKPHTQGCED